MDNRAKTQQEIEKEMLELNEQFAAFLNTKGITAKFKLAFNNMSESLKKQHAQDIAEFEAVKAQSAEDNKEFAEFLRTKGIKAKYKLVIDNINLIERVYDDIVGKLAGVGAEIRKVSLPD